MQHQSSVVYSEQLSKILIFFHETLFYWNWQICFAPQKRKNITPSDELTKFIINATLKNNEYNRINFIIF
jgi:hypothetical protein